MTLLQNMLGPSKLFNYATLYIHLTVFASVLLYGVQFQMIKKQTIFYIAFLLPLIFKGRIQIGGSNPEPSLTARL